MKAQANFPQLFAKNQKCTYNADGRRYSVEEQSLSDNNQGSKCTRCGGRLGDGYVMAGRGLWWDREPHRVLPAGETIISQGMSSAPAERCFNCKLVIIPMP